MPCGYRGLPNCSGVLYDGGMTTKQRALQGDWYREIAAFYRKYANDSDYQPRKLANYNEAAKYEAIAARMDRIA